MMTDHASYIGVTGFMSREECIALLKVLPHHSSRRLMVGVLANYHTLRGEKNNFPQRYPQIDHIADIFPLDPRVMNVIHYFTPQQNTLLDQLVALTRYGGKNLHGIQLNITWPDVRILMRYKDLYPEKQLILVIGPEAMSSAHHSPEEVALRIADTYAQVIDYVLFDSSMGKGESFLPRKMMEYAQSVQNQGVGCGLVIAGGLSDSTLDLLDALVGVFPEMSIDAEGRLRDANDRLDLVRAAQYVRHAYALFCGM